MPTAVKPFKVTYDLDLYVEDDEELFVFQPTVPFIAKGQPNVHIAIGTWYDWGKPSQIKVTIEPV